MAGRGIISGGPGSRARACQGCQARPNSIGPMRPRLPARRRHGRIGASRNKPGSVTAAVSLYFQSLAFGNLAPGTQRDRRRILEHFREAHGDDRFALLERKHVDALLLEKGATPHAARHFLDALRGVITVAIVAGLRDDDPTQGARVKASKTDGFRTWGEDEIAQFEAVHPIGTRARLAFALLLYTAQRRSDVIRMGRQHVRDGFITIRQEKTGAVLQNNDSRRPARSPGRAASGRAPDVSSDRDGCPVRGEWLHAFVSQNVRQGRFAAGPIGARATQGRLPSTCGGWVLGKSDCCDFRPCYASRSFALYKSGRSEAAGVGRDASHCPESPKPEHRVENWPAQVENTLRNPLKSKDNEMQLTVISGRCMAGGPGFEPRLTESES